MLYVSDKRPRVVTVWQLIAIIVMFGSVLYFLHVDKKSFYQNLLKGENSNYDLTAIYLKNILTLEPENAKYLYEFANVMIKKGDYDMAKATLKAFDNLPSENHWKKKAIILNYELFKRQYYMTNDPKVRQHLLKKMSKLYEKIVHSTFFKKLSLLKMQRWLSESWFVKRPDIRLEILAQITAKYPRLVKYNEELLQEAIALKRYDLALKALKNLERDLDRLEGKEYRDRLHLLIQGYEALGQTDKVRELLMRDYRQSRNPEDIFKAIQLLVWAGDYKQAVALGHKYQDVLIQNRKDAQKLLDLYLQAGRVEDARRLSLELLKRFGQ